jgi:acetyl-CoA acyltransferase
MPEGEQGMNVARISALLAGVPHTASAMTINRFCSSGMQAIALAARAVETGECDVAVAGGTESMSLVPMGGQRYSPNPTLVEDRPEVYLGMGLTAERLGKKRWRPSTRAASRTRSCP